MTRYKCKKCKKIWYTADTHATKCECGGTLENEKSQNNLSTNDKRN